MNYLLTILTINIMMVFITDCTDWPDFLKRQISYILTKGVLKTDNWSFHLIDCSLCQVFHLSNIFLIIYIILFGKFEIWWLIINCLSAFFTPVTYNILLKIKDLIIKLINLI